MKVFFDRHKIEAGCDEAGRGCLAGPVFAAAVILPKSFRHPYLTDSKKLPVEKRYKLRDLIQRLIEHLLPRLIEVGLFVRGGGR